MNGARVYVLDEDPDLLEAVPEQQRPAARHASATTVATLAAGAWDAAEDPMGDTGGYGLLVLGGLLLRRVGSGGRFGAELLAAGDLLRPWDVDGEDIVGLQAHWKILLPARVAVLDEAWASRMSRHPAVGPALSSRALGRSRRLVALAAIAQQPRLDDRLWAIFWELAARHGRVRAGTVHIDLPLTHEVLSHLACARRPSVSGALSRMASQGRLYREDRGWTLAGEPPSLS